MRIKPVNRKFDKAFEIKQENVQKHQYQCKNCGRKEVIRFDRDKTICSHCHKYVFKNEEDEKKYEFAQKMKGLLK